MNAYLVGAMFGSVAALMLGLLFDGRPLHDKATNEQVVQLGLFMVLAVAAMFSAMFS